MCCDDRATRDLGGDLGGDLGDSSRRFIPAHSLSAWATAEKSAGARSAQYEMSSTRSREAGWPICVTEMVRAQYAREDDV